MGTCSALSSLGVQLGQLKWLLRDESGRMREGLIVTGVCTCDVEQTLASEFQRIGVT